MPCTDSGPRPTYYLLLTNYYLLFTNYYLLLTPHYSLLTTLGEPLTDTEIGQAFAQLQVEWVDTEQTTLSGTLQTDVAALCRLLDRMGADAATLLLPTSLSAAPRRYEFERSSYGNRVLNVTVLGVTVLGERCTCALHVCPARTAFSLMLP